MVLPLMLLDLVPQMMPMASRVLLLLLVLLLAKQRLPE